MSKENEEWLLEYLQNELKEIIQFINNRKKIEEFAGEDHEMFDINMYAEDMQYWEADVLENHNYDLGRYYILKEIIKKLERKQNDNL